MVSLVFPTLPEKIVAGFSATNGSMVVFREQKPFFGRVLSSATTHLLLLHINGSLTSAGESSSGCQGAEEVTSSKNLLTYIPPPARQWAGPGNAWGGGGQPPSCLAA